MEESQIPAEEKAFKKKKKFVYLDKFESYKEAADQRMEALEKSVNIGYIGMGALAIWLLLISLTK